MSGAKPFRDKDSPARAIEATGRRPQCKQMDGHRPDERKALLHSMALKDF